MTDITTVLQKALADNGPTLGVTIPGAQPRTTPCFFFDCELNHTKEMAIIYGRYSHVKLYKGHYLDYVNKNEYPSLEAWAETYHMSIDNILFGYNKFDGRGSYIRLAQLMQYLSPPPPPPVDPAVEELTRFANRLRIDELTFQNNILVITQTAGIQGYTQYMS